MFQEQLSLVEVLFIERMRHPSFNHFWISTTKVLAKFHITIKLCE